MTDLVIDASVAVKWYFPEIHQKKSFLVLKNINTALVPDLIFAEIGSVIWKRVRKAEITESINELKNFFTITSNYSLLPSALEIAIDKDAICVTANEKFYRKIYNSELRKYILWIEDYSS